MDQIIIRDLQVKGKLGADHWEQARYQMLIFNIIGFIDFAAEGDKIQNTISYSTLSHHIQGFVETETKIKSLEGLAAKIALDCLQFGLKKVIVKIEKSHALLHAETVGICITRVESDIPFLQACCVPTSKQDYALPITEDFIFIKDLAVSCIIGVNPCERIEKQRVILNIELLFEPSVSIVTNYRTIATRVNEFLETSDYRTIESMATDVSNIILHKCDIDKVTIRIEKPSALMFARTAGVQISRSKERKHISVMKSSVAYLAIGTNLGDRLGSIHSAIDRLLVKEIKVIDTSFLYETGPKYVIDQPMFLNAAIKVETTLDPESLLRKLKEIEAEMGRDFNQIRNGPRVIDLDILYFDDIEYNSSTLTIPHPRIQERFFVLTPLADIASNYNHPTLFRNTTQLLKLLRNSDVEQDVIQKVFPIRSKFWNFKERPLIMGILNITSDSFSDGSLDLNTSVQNALKMVERGADIIDIGGQSTAPNKPEITSLEEIGRVVPVILAIRKINSTIPLSIDTFRADVAKAAIDAGVDLINDVSGGSRDPMMLSVMASTKGPVCLMHMRGNSATMQSLATYEGDLMEIIQQELTEVVQNAISEGVCRWNIMIDPGIGFAKNSEQNLDILRRLNELTDCMQLNGMPMLVGVSRKGFIGKITNKSIPADRVFGSAAATTASIMKGACMLRVHDVGEMKDVALVAEATFDVHKCPRPASSTTATKEEMLTLYKVMLEIRRLEMACDQAYKAKQIRGFCHLSIGQEAVAAGMEAAITKEDSIITAYRCHGFTLTRGQSAVSILAELMGRKTGTSHGKGGSMHLFGKEFYGGNGIVGAQVPVGAGIALAHKYRNNNSMVFALYGDGAANQGQVFEAYNIAKLWDLPVAFVCENNNYGMGTSAERAAASTAYYSRGDYVPGIRVNGMDVLAVREASRYAREWTLAGKGPIILEMVTYRYGGHSMSDPGTTYRTREEIQHMRSTNDPISGIKERIIKHQFATEPELKAMEKVIRADMDKAVLEALATAEPDLSELYTDIYEKGTEPPFIRGVTHDQGHRFS